MGREVKRVPLGFNWPVNKVWWGYELEGVPCLTCRGRGWISYRPFPENYDGWDGKRSDGDGYWCPHCEGERIAFSESIEVPVGDGWQMWETTSDGSPISPVFETPESLARWLADTGASVFGDLTATYEEWLATIAHGSARWSSLSNKDGR